MQQLFSLPFLFATSVSYLIANPFRNLGLRSSNIHHLLASILTMAPSSTEIKSIFESHILSQTSAVKQGSDTSGSAQPGHLFHLFTDDVDFQIPGDGFSLACQVRGNQAVEKYLTKSKASFSSIMDPSKPMHVEVVQVMGGGESQWATAVLKTTATTKTGESLSS